MQKRYVVYWEPRYGDRRYLRSMKANGEGWSLTDYNFDSVKDNGYCFSDYDRADLEAGHLASISKSDLYMFGVEEMEK